MMCFRAKLVIKNKFVQKLTIFHEKRQFEIRYSEIYFLFCRNTVKTRKLMASVVTFILKNESFCIFKKTKFSKSYLSSFTKKVARKQFR